MKSHTKRNGRYKENLTNQVSFRQIEKKKMDENDRGAGDSSSATTSAAATDESEKLCEINEESKNESENKDNAASDVVVAAKPKTENPIQSLEEFKKELSLKRQGVMCELKAKINCLRQQLADEKEISEQLRNEQRNHKCCGANDASAAVCQNKATETSMDEITTHGSTPANNDLDSMAMASGQLEHNANNNNNIALKSELADVQLSLQLANAEILSLTAELSATHRQVASLKEVIMFSKQMVDIRENQLNQVRANIFDSAFGAKSHYLIRENFFFFVFSFYLF